MKKIVLSKTDFLRISKCIEKAIAAKTISEPEARNLLSELKNASIVEPEKIRPDVVTMNSEVEISFAGKKGVMRFQIVYPHKANIKEKKVSILSPVATALIGYSENDEIEWLVPSGLTKIKIERIIYQPEANGDYDL